MADRWRASLPRPAFAVELRFLMEVVPAAMLIAATVAQAREVVA